MSYNDEQLIKL